ncbi:hypothetical protein LWI29_026233 [Acer saccharum]|uniref:Uncharacterized protein n=1 Tax=Acer saccharum TaxID=4024 RepID=A0AA39V2W6_ACESA|nr:hypothetical protein LWI29_026233 [Acer saccharum]
MTHQQAGGGGGVVACLCVLRYVDALRVLRIGGFTYFALAVLRCSVSETLRVLHWLCFGAPYWRLYVFCTGCVSVLRIGGFSAPMGDFLVLPRALARSRFFCFRLRSFVFGDTFRDRAPLNLRFYSLRWRVVHQEVS